MGKVLAQYYTDLRVDLKDSGTLWSDAELQRCIERAVADLSRFLPRELQTELTFDFTVKNETFTTPAASDTDYFVTTWDISASVDGAVATLAARKPDVPRPVRIAVTDANTSITALVVIVKGYDIDSKYIEEYFYLTGGLIQTGKKYFALVTEIEIEKIAGNGAADTMIVGTGTHLGVYIQLANKPIKKGSVTITSYTLDTDYVMDYSSGGIAMKSGGTMVAATQYTITEYTKSQITVDLGDIIDGLLDIDRVEYPSGNVPQDHHQIERWGKKITLAGGADSQAAASDAQHIVVSYRGAHSPPQTQGAGSFPAFLDYTVQLAAGAYALFVKALQYEHQAVTDLASSATNLTSAGTALGSLSAIHTAADAALDKVTTHVTEAGTALTAAAVQAAAAATALAKVATYLENNTAEDAKGWLTKITTDIASLRTAIVTALDAANTELDAGDFTLVATYLNGASNSALSALNKVATYLESNTNEDSKFWLTKITTDIAALRTAIATAIDAANAYLDEVDVTDLGKATVGAEAYTETGDDKIDAINTGNDVAQLYANYSRARVDIASVRVNAALGFVQEAQTRLTNLRTYIEQAEGWGRVAAGFVSEASQRIAMAAQIVNRESVVAVQAEGYVREANSRLDNLRSYIEQSAGWTKIATGFVEEASQRVAAGNVYVNEAGQRLGMAQAFINEAAGRCAEMDRYLEEAAKYQVTSEQYQTKADRDIALAKQFKEEAVERRNEAWSIWRSPAQLAVPTAYGSKMQPQ